MRLWENNDNSFKLAVCFIYSMLYSLFVGCLLVVCWLVVGWLFVVCLLFVVCWLVVGCLLVVYWCCSTSFIPSLKQLVVGTQSASESGGRTTLQYGMQSSVIPALGLRSTFTTRLSVLPMAPVNHFIEGLWNNMAFPGDCGRWVTTGLPP